MRARAAAAACALLLGARCAHMEPPPGGPMDTVPPAVAAVYPAPGALNVPADARLVFEFTEWIDRNAARGQVLLSPPHPGRLRLEADENRLVVRLPAGQGLRPNTTYAATVQGIKDVPLRGGTPMTRAFTLRFSTGPAFDSASIGGALSLEGRRGTLVAALYAAPGARSQVEALSPRDTGFRPADRPEPWRELPAYLAAADSAGRFRIEGARPGDYALLAFEDVNGNFAFDLGLEAAATGELSLALRPRGPDQSLSPVPLDTVPLRIGEATFQVDSAGGDTAGGLLPGFVRLKFTRAPYPARAAEAARYRLLPDSGAPVPVLGAAWDPGQEAWVLEVPPLRAGARLRVELRGRPDFPGRADVAASDTSLPFVVEPGAAAAPWALSPLLPPGPSGLARSAGSPLPGALQTFASNLPLTAARWSAVESRLEVLTGDSLPVPFRAQRLGPLTLTLRLSRPLRAGSLLELRLRRPAEDTTPTEFSLYSGRAPDSATLGAVSLHAPAAAGRVLWLQPVQGGESERVLAGEGDTLKAAHLAAGTWRLVAFRDRDGDGVRDPGALKPWIPQEPSETVLDSVTVAPGTVNDLTERVRQRADGER